MNINLQTLKEASAKFLKNNLDEMMNQQYDWQKQTKDPKIVEDMKEQAKTKLRNLFSSESYTPYESPWYVSMLEKLSDEIEESAQMIFSFPELKKPLSDLGFNLEMEKPCLGTLPTGRVNALTIDVPNSDNHLVVFDGELFTFCNLLCKSIALAIPFKEMNDGKQVFSTNFEDIKNHIDNSDAFLRFNNLLWAYFVRGRVSAAQKYFLKGHATTIQKNLLKTMERFILGHEYAHIYGGHLSKEYATSPALFDPNISEIDYKWDQEYSADAIGLLLSIAPSVKHKVDPSLIYWGAELFFDAMDIIDKGHSVVNYGNDDISQGKKLHSGSHPTSHDRRIKLRKLVTTLYGENPAKLGELMEKILEYLWEKSKPFLLHLHESKKQIP